MCYKFWFDYPIFQIKKRRPRWPNLHITFHTDVRNFIFSHWKASRNKGDRNIWVWFALYCLYKWYNVFSETFTIHCIRSCSIQYFFIFSGLRSNLTKCETTAIRALKGIKLAVYGMKCIDLRNETIKILGTYFSYNNTTKEQSNFIKVVSKVQTVLKLW